MVMGAFLSLFLWENRRGGGFSFSVNALCMRHGRSSCGCDDWILFSMLTSSKYECVRTVTIGMTDHLGIVRLAVEKLKEFVEDLDQNRASFVSTKKSIVGIECIDGQPISIHRQESACGVMKC